ncbi:electron transfer flavoprotein subunit alpha/FixB family protein [Egibacter rhizosphaerae]|uniref:Electron transfer flavoprotein subunit alpha/FixB family protein n=1 Tax=Egibacter rhizosphaerae TaxID=1670831 RepID=A0A411YDE7_9ACTN|nr:electron transfer flavoprotein subunit alpha/FixB family protein [Egibacter rhizosphaerae]QBI19243.1 electron transfer flavoprotein subunit alpha/FixB family protein [Egibacter rhizosphaerae]
MSGVLGFVEHGPAGPERLSLEMLTVAAGDDGVEAVVVGQPGAGTSEQLCAFGVDRLHVIDHDLVGDYAPEAWAEGLRQLIATRDPEVVLAGGGEHGNEVMAHVAARLDEPLATNCVVLTPEGTGTDGWHLTRLRWGGILYEDAVLTSDRKLATIAPHVVEPVPSRAAAQVPVEAFAAELDPVLARTRVRDRTTRSAGVSLATAPVVVSGGRGVGSAEGFAVLEELAELVGGAVGCSRVVTNNGWRPHSDQVGQTGTRVAPDLYVACGISGATQHWVGCMNAKAILAINTDPEAPMVTRADYAVIGDVHEVLPALVEEVRSRQAAPV